ncbi:vacuolar protein sorting-associated protein 72 homolog [Limulus polyphemus]|uniref:Vacuolar protein sorting-associated protein 72 homolog n=1 Tax=Limulus polyphemus TaxID=6850 RepID=A0ABM1TJ24_LIMPO|nr:vacuolar protein sorting-associated protein 72 homolog [Limulus polyphemus]
MAAMRERRANAGNRMSRIINEEEKDDFYHTTYGGFEEEEDDVDYHSEIDESDEVDSDFSIDENDELVSDQEDEEEGKRKKKTTTRAYKEPKKTGDKVKRESKSTTTEKISRDDPNIVIFSRNDTSIITDNCFLESYQRLELERKKTKFIKHTYKGPVIRYHSVSMPLIEELPTVVTTEASEQENSNRGNLSSSRCSRNFISFTDEGILREYFPCKKPKPVTRNVCPITRLPARYFDPVTHIPYANLQAFKFLREAYYQQLEQKGDLRQPEVAAWVEWRKKNKPPPKQPSQTSQPTAKSAVGIE